MRVTTLTVSIVLLSFAAACSPQASDKKSKAAELPPVQTALVAAAKAEASAVCSAETSVKPIGSADFNGDGVDDVIVDWSETACAKTNEDVCSQTLGCVQQVWLEATGAKTSIFSGRALNVAVSTAGERPDLVVDQAGEVCGRPNTETCRAIYAWDPRTLSLQERERQVLATKK